MSLKFTGNSVIFDDGSTQTIAWTGDVDLSHVSGLQSALDSKQNSGNYASLVNGTIPSNQLPSYVDDVLEYVNLAGFPISGETSKIYIALDNNKTYRWSGSTYVEISPSPGSTDSIPEGSVNKYYTDARASAAAPVQSVNGKTGAVTVPVYPIRAYIVGGMISLSNSSDNSYFIGLPIVYSNDIPDFDYVPLKLFGSIEYGQTSILVNCQSNINQALLDFPGKYVSYSSLEVVLVDADNKIVGWATSATSPAPMPTHGSDGYKLTINLFDFPDLSGVPDTWVLTNPSNSVDQYEGRIFTDPVAYKQISSRFIDNLEHNWNNIPNDPIKNIVAGTNILVTNTHGNFTIGSTGVASKLTTIVFNKTGSVVPKMTAVYINGGQGDMPTIGLAKANTESTSSKTYGLTAEAIDNMSTGVVIVYGALTGLNTGIFNPSHPHGDVNGTTLWLSPSTAGGLTTTKPTAPNHMVAIGTIVRTHQNEGIIEVRVQNGFELNELHDVAISGVDNNHTIIYDNGLWKNKPGIISDTSAVSGSLPIKNIISVTQAQYDSILTKDPNTLYVIR